MADENDNTGDENTGANQTPDPTARIAELEAQITAAAARETAALNTTRVALQAAHPDLPEAVFQAETLEALTANVEAHVATAAHIRAHTPPPGAVVNPGGGTDRTPPAIPDHIRGTARIARALEQQAGG